MNGATIAFKPRQVQGTRVAIADAEITFTAGPLAGLKLVGVSIWRGSKGLYVTLPARPSGTGLGRQYHDYLRPADDGDGIMVVKKLKDQILEAFMATRTAELTRDAP